MTHGVFPEQIRSEGALWPQATGNSPPREAKAAGDRADVGVDDLGTLVPIVKNEIGIRLSAARTVLEATSRLREVADLAADVLELQRIVEAMPRERDRADDRGPPSGPAHSGLGNGRAAGGVA